MSMGTDNAPKLSLDQTSTKHDEAFAHLSLTLQLIDALHAE